MDRLRSLEIGFYTSAAMTGIFWVVLPAILMWLQGATP